MAFDLWEPRQYTYLCARAVLMVLIAARDRRRGAKLGAMAENRLEMYRMTSGVRVPPQ